jgi:hypothetical protein
MDCRRPARILLLLVGTLFLASQPTAKQLHARRKRDGGQLAPVPG